MKNQITPERFYKRQPALRGPNAGGLAIILCTGLAGCFAPVTQREAEDIAQNRLTKYCNNRCGAFALAKSQKIKDRWLVDFDSSKRKFTVTVEGNGNAKVTTWDK